MYIFDTAWPICICLSATWFGATALLKPEMSWCGKHLSKVIRDSWAGGTKKSHRNLSIAVLVLGVMTWMSVILSKLLRQ